MDSNRKAELKRTYKETALRKGVFKVYSSKTDQTWVGTSSNVDSFKNRIWFTLKWGNQPNHDLQQAWNEGGSDSIEYEVIEVFKDDVTGYALERLMKERMQHWIEKLGAEPFR